MRFDLVKRFIFSSPKKQINLLKNYLAFYLKSPKVFGLPSRLMIEPANFCNLRCPTCPVGAGEIVKTKGAMSLENFKKIIDETGDYLYHLTLWNWGEPFLNKDLAEMIKYARRKNIYVITSTNGHFFDERTCEAIIDSGLNELIIALDGLSQETLSQYRVGADFKKIEEGIKTLVRLKREKKSALPKLQLQFIAMKHNQHEAGKVKEFAINLGFNKAVIKTFGSHLDINRLKEFEPEGKLSRYSKPVKEQNNCQRIYLGMNINYDGTVVPCCYDPKESKVLGNVLENGVRQVWQGDKFTNFRRAILTDKKAIGICRNCDYNKDISKIINLDNHVRS
jgi:radical SAM protein with 4Fe4S-binding SPASM domain